MKSLIKALYLNMLDIPEKGVIDDPEYQSILGIRSKAIEKLRKRLSEDDNELLNRIAILHSEIELYEETDLFKRGFYLGVLMMTEVMSSRESTLGEN